MTENLFVFPSKVNIIAQSEFLKFTKIDFYKVQDIKNIQMQCSTFVLSSALIVLFTIFIFNLLVRTRKFSEMKSFIQIKLVTTA